MSEKKKTLVLLDSHAVLHRAFHALPSFTSPTGESTGALYGFTATLLKTIKDFKPDYLVACFDLPEPTFRHKVYDNYKAKRPKMDSELSIQIDKSKEILSAFGVPVYEKAGFEADDVLATIVENARSVNLDIVVVSGDLDTLQLVQPGVKVYTMKKGITESVFYDEGAVRKRYGFSPKLIPDMKGLQGDPSDNIIGVPGIGEKTAKILIQNFGTLEDMYEELENNKSKFEKVGLKPRIIKILEDNKENALFSKTLAEVRTNVPIKFSLKEAEQDSKLDKTKIEEIFTELGFRNFLKNIFPVKLNITESSPLSSSSEDSTDKLKLAFWLLDSRRTNPSMEDVFAFTKSESIEESQKILEKEIEKEGFSDLFDEIEEPLVSVLSEMENNGILLDVNYLKILSKDYHKKIDKLENKIWKLAGEEFNIKSPKQLGEVLFSRMNISTRGVRKTGQGAFSTRFSELEKIKDRHPIIEEIVSFRQFSKLTSTYIDNLPNLVDKNNRLHTSFNQTGTTTGRLSSSEPNLQNIPIRTDFGLAVRKAFIVPKGWKLVSLDYSQIELRVAAALSDDKKLKEAFLAGKDIHTKVASEVFNTPFNKVTSEMRRRAKVINFGIIYGMGINSLRKNLECSREEAESFFREYFSDFSGMANYLEEIKKETRRKGFTETLFKRRRYLPEINSHLGFVQKEAERMAINAPIQGTAADIIKIAMVKTQTGLQEKKWTDKVRLVLQVHDELLFEIKDDIIKESSLFIKKIMENIDLPGGVPLIADVLVGSNWAELKNIKY